MKAIIKTLLMLTVLTTTVATAALFTACSEDEEDAAQAAGICPDANHPHLIDLGLPSGTKWSCTNVGATKPEKCGGYYAWGETEEKSNYSSETYQYQNEEEFSRLGDDISGTRYDVATVKLGSRYQMPTYAQCKELMTQCTKRWTVLNGVKGGMFTGPNGAAIFLPASDVNVYGGFTYEGAHCTYWSSTKIPDFTSAYYLLYYNGYNNNEDWNASCYTGNCVRPVAN